MKSIISILVSVLVGALAQPWLSSHALAQTKALKELQAQQLPTGQIGPPKARLHGIKSHPSDSLKLYSATARGLQVSEDRGLSWQLLAIGGTEEEVFAFSVNPVNPNILFAGRRDGLWKSKDGGLSWSPMSYPGPVPLAIAVAKSEPKVVYLATSRQGVHKSNDGGYRWLEASNGLPEARTGGRPEEIRTLVVDPDDHNIAYAALARHGIYRTTDGGQNWQKFNEGLPFLMGGPTRAPKIAFDPDDPQHPYLVLSQRIHSHLIKTHLYVLSDNEEWLPTGVELPSNFPVLDLNIDGTKATLQLWGPDAVWELPLPEKGRINR